VRQTVVRVQAVNKILPTDRSRHADVPIDGAWRVTVAAVVFLDALDDQLSRPPLASGVGENARPGCPADDGRGHAQTFNDLSLRMVSRQTSDLCSTVLGGEAGALVAKSSRDAPCGEDLVDTLRRQSKDIAERREGVVGY
jgi:hypothetical protein